MKTLNLITKKKKVSFSHEENQALHFKTRWFQRMGYILTDGRLKSLREEIKKKGKFKFYSHSGNPVMSLRMDGINLFIVWDGIKQIPITILTPPNRK